MSYAKFTFLIITGLYVLLEIVAHDWYLAVLPGASPKEFLIPLLMLLWVALQVFSGSIGEGNSVGHTVGNGIVAGTASGLAVWFSILIQNPEMLMEIGYRTLSYGYFGITLLFLLQLVLGGWLIGLLSFYTVRKSYPFFCSPGR